MGSKKRRLKSRKRCKFHGNQFTKDSATIYSDEAINDPLGNSKHQEKTDDEHKVEGHQLNRPRVVSGIMEHLREELKSSPQFKTNLATLGISD